MFAAKSLPHDQGEYQFCYYSTTKGAVYGSSGPFVFKSMDSEYVEEEIAGDDMIFVMSTTEVLREKIHTLEEVMVVVFLFFSSFVSTCHGSQPFPSVCHVFFTWIVT